MKALIVYESFFGNTEQVAEAVAEGMRPSAELEVVEVAEAPREPAPDVDVLVVGGPTHAFSMSRPRSRTEANRQGGHAEHERFGLREWLSLLPVRGHPARLATFDTRAKQVRHLPGSAARVAAREATRHGYRMAAPAQSFYVADLDGPLLDGELDRARAWGEQLVSDLQED